MKFAFTLLPAIAFPPSSRLWWIKTTIGLVSPFCLAAQCTDIELSTLQVIEKAAPVDKEAKILELGFDLISESGTGATNTRKYHKCWHTTDNGKAIYEQVIYWRTNVNDITFLTLNERSFDTLKKAVDERHSTGGGKQTVVGKMFRYSFDKQSIGGYEYFAVTVAMKG